MIFFPGQRISCRGEEWQIQRTHQHKIANGGSTWEIEATGLSGITRGQQYIFLSDLDRIEIIDPSDVIPRLDDSAHVIQSRTFLEAHLRRLLPRNGAIYLGQHGALSKIYDYQLSPASHALHQDRPRLLIADSVGLGKTIECGVLLSELIRRGKGKRILAAVPKATLEQFQMEMWGRFSIPFHRLDSEGLEKLKQDLPSTMNPFYYYDKALISIDTLKLKKYQERLKNCDWDVLIIDEAHNVADRTMGGEGSLRHKVAKNLAANSKAIILMSATPHDGTKKGFASLIKILDPTAIPNEESYTKDHIRPFFIRRTRTDVANQLGDTRIRKQILQKVPMTETEINLLQSLHDHEFQSKGLSQRSQHGIRELFRTTLIKSFLSSPAALYETCVKKVATLEKSQAKDGMAIQHDIEKLKNIIFDIETNKLHQKSSRLDYLIQQLKTKPPEPSDKIVIFTERLATLHMLKDALVKASLANNVWDPTSTGSNDRENVSRSGRSTKNKINESFLAFADGSMDDKRLMATVKAFQSGTSGVNILVATNVASEGLNLHENCHRLYHYDLPWSLITLEQRNGRIDRLGQKFTPNIFYLASTASQATRESDLTQLKDDFWIVEKIQNRMSLASQDLDEEALRMGITSSEQEDEINALKYEGSQTSSDNISDDVIEDLFSKSFDQATSELYKKELPTLFKDSPSDFVKNASKLTQLKTEFSNSLVSIESNARIKTEISQWPKNLKPLLENDSFLHLEGDPSTMEKHYYQSLNLQSRLSKTFMNEIHPLIQALEERALEGIFSGKEVPTIKIDNGEPGVSYFLLQGSLFNQLNEYVFQTWELLEFSSGKNECQKMVNLYEPNHTQEVVDFVNECLNNYSRDRSLTELETKRLQKLSSNAITWMKEQMKKARDVRAKELKSQLSEKLSKIRQWEEERRQYLEKIVSGTVIANEVHGGIQAQRKQAEKELEKLGGVSTDYQRFIQNSLMTNSESEVRILAIFQSTGKQP